MLLSTVRTRIMSLPVHAWYLRECHIFISVCIQSHNHTQFFSFQVSTKYELWPNVPDETLEQNCTLYQQVIEMPSTSTCSSVI